MVKSPALHPLESCLHGRMAGGSTVWRSIRDIFPNVNIFLTYLPNNYHLMIENLGIIWFESEGNLKLK